MDRQSVLVKVGYEGYSGQCLQCAVHGYEEVDDGKGRCWSSLR